MGLIEPYLSVPIGPAGLALFGGYLLGSIPFGLIFSMMAGQGDIRNIGSGNIGATNALRTGKKWVAFLTLLGDIGKGFAAVFLARTVLNPDVGMIAGVAAFLGHLYPVWIGFRGGKGVATYLGILLALIWPVGVGVCAVWLLTLALFRISSLASLNTAFLAPIFALGIGANQFFLAILLLSILIFIKHRPNIARLRDGTEPKIGKRSQGS